jgi:hypothetical protein
MEFRVEIWKKFADVKARGTEDDTMEDVARKITNELLGENNEWFDYPEDCGETLSTEAMIERSERRTRLAIAVLCECGENTVAPDGDDDDSNDVSSVDNIAKGGCLLAAVSKLEEVLERLEIGEGLHPEEDEKSKKNRLRKKLPPPILTPLCTLACHAALGRQSFELGLFNVSARLLHTFLRRTQCCPKEIEVELDPPIIFDDEIQEERHMTDEEMEAEGIIRGTRKEVIVPEPSCMLNENINVDVNDLKEWVAEVRLLDAVLELEHPKEHGKYYKSNVVVVVTSIH